MKCEDFVGMYTTWFDIWLDLDREVHIAIDNEKPVEDLNKYFASVVDNFQSKWHLFVTDVVEKLHVYNLPEADPE